MKTKVLTVISLLFLCSCLAMAQDSPFKQWMKMPGVKSSFITKPMLELAENTKIGAITVGDLDDRLDQVEIYNNARQGSIQQLAIAMRNEAIRIVENGKYEIILSLNEDGGEILFYGKMAEGKKDTIADLIMITYAEGGSAGRFTLIRLVGALTYDDLKDIRPAKKKSASAS